MADDLAAQFKPDYTPEQMENLGVYDALYRGKGPRLASLGAWKPEWISEHDPKGWAQWYKRYASGRRIPDEDERQMKRWLSFKARHGGPFTKNPTPRRGWALRNWGVDPANLVTNEARNGVVEMLDEYQRKAMQKHLKAQTANSADANSERQIGGEKQAELLPEVQLQEHQQRIADRMTGGDNRLLVYHGLGSGKSLSALAAAEAAKKVYGDQYGVVAPAALKGNFDKEVKKFTKGSDPEIMSYTGLGMGKQFKTPPQTLIMDEAHRLRNPGGSAAQSASREARNAKNLLLLTGSPITNSPTDLANLISLLDNKKLTPEQFEEKFVGYKSVSPGVLNWLRGIQSGEQPAVKNEDELRGLLRGKVDYQPSKTPDGVNVEEEVVKVPLSPAQQKIQKAVRTKIPPGFLWKLDREFPLSRDELSKLNSFLTGLRQVSISTRPFRADKDPLKSYEQSAKLQQAMKDLQETLTSDERKKAIIYSNHIEAGLSPYAAALSKNNIPHALFHGGISARERQRAVNEYNEGKLRALLIGPAGAEGLSTKGTSLIQLLDPHWHESRSQQAKGRGLRFDSHRDLPEELKNVAVKRYISSSEDPSWLGKLMGYQRERTGDEILEHLAQNKEMLNDKFRQILKEEGAVKSGAVMWFRAKQANNILQLPWVSQTGDKKKRKKRKTPDKATDNTLAGAAAMGAASLPLLSLHQDVYGAYPNLKMRLQDQNTPIYFADELAKGTDAQGKPLVRHGDVGTVFGQPQGFFKSWFTPNFSKMTQGGEWTSGTGTYHGMMMRPHQGDVQVLEGGDAFPGGERAKPHDGFLHSHFHDWMRQRDKQDAAKGLIPQKDIGLYSLSNARADGTPNPQTDSNLRDLPNNTSAGVLNRNFLSWRRAAFEPEGEAKKLPFFQRWKYYSDHFKRQNRLLQDYLKEVEHRPELKEQAFGRLSDRDPTMLVTRSNAMSRLLDKPETAGIAKGRVDRAYQEHAYRPYDLFGAVRAGAGRVLFPKIAPQELSPGANLTAASIPSALPLRCKDDYCVQPVARTLSGLGIPIGVTPSQALPADLATNTDFSTVGLVVPKPEDTQNMSPDAVRSYKDNKRKEVLDWMRQSRNRRVVTGLVAAAAMGGLGYGGAKLIQGWWKRRQEALAAAEKEKRKKTLRQPTRRKAAAENIITPQQKWYQKLPVPGLSAPPSYTVRPNPTTNAAGGQPRSLPVIPPPPSLKKDPIIGAMPPSKQDVMMLAAASPTTRQKYLGHLPGQTVNEMQQLNSGADNWINRNYLTVLDDNNAPLPSARNRAHVAMSNQLPDAAARAAYNQSQQNMFWSRARTAPTTGFNLKQINEPADQSYVARHVNDPSRPPDIHLGTQPNTDQPVTRGPWNTALHELEHTRQDDSIVASAQTPPGLPHFPPRTARVEPPAVLSEIVHAAQGVQNATGKRVEGSMELTPQYQPKLDWMRQQAIQHGHLGGDKSMTELLNTAAGQAWLRMQYKQLAEPQK